MSDSANQDLNNNSQTTPAVGSSSVSSPPLMVTEEVKDNTVSTNLTNETNLPNPSTPPAVPEPTVSTPQDPVPPISSYSGPTNDNTIPPEPVLSPQPPATSSLADISTTSPITPSSSPVSDTSDTAPADSGFTVSQDSDTANPVVAVPQAPSTPTKSKKPYFVAALIAVLVFGTVIASSLIIRQKTQNLSKATYPNPCTNQVCASYGANTCGSDTELVRACYNASGVNQCWLLVKDCPADVQAGFVCRGTSCIPPAEYTCRNLTSKTCELPDTGLTCTWCSVQNKCINGKDNDTNCPNPEPTPSASPGDQCSGFTDRCTQGTASFCQQEPNGCKSITTDGTNGCTGQTYPNCYVAGKCDTSYGNSGYVCNCEQASTNYPQCYVWKCKNINTQQCPNNSTPTGDCTGVDGTTVDNKWKKTGTCIKNVSGDSLNANIYTCPEKICAQTSEQCSENQQSVVVSNQQTICLPETCGVNQIDTITGCFVGGCVVCPSPSPHPTGHPSPSPSPSPTPNPSPSPEIGAMCVNIKVYQVTGDVNVETNWHELTYDQLPLLKAGDVIYITTLGATVTKYGSIGKARIRVNSDIWTVDNETTNIKPSSVILINKAFYVIYTIPADVNTFKFESEVWETETQKWY